MTATDAGAALPRAKIDILPALTPLIVAAIAAPFVGSLSTFVTLTLAGLAMGMMIFIMASGPDARLRHDGRAQFRPRRLHRRSAPMSRRWCCCR